MLSLSVKLQNARVLTRKIAISLLTQVGKFRTKEDRADAELRQLLGSDISDVESIHGTLPWRRQRKDGEFSHQIFSLLSCVLLLPFQRQYFYIYLSSHLLLLPLSLSVTFIVSDLFRFVSLNFSPWQFRTR